MYVGKHIALALHDGADHNQCKMVNIGDCYGRLPWGPYGVSDYTSNEDVSSHFDADHGGRRNQTGSVTCCVQHGNRNQGVMKTNMESIWGMCEW